MKNAWRWYRQRSIGTQIFIGMAIGVVVGFWMGPSAARLKPVGDIFIRLLVMAAIPLIFFTLMSGLTTIKEAGFVGRLTARILVYYVVTSIIAFAIAIVVMDWMQPGSGFQLKGEVKGEIGQMPSLATIVLDIFPDNIMRAFATGNVTQIVVFGVFLGVAALWLEDQHRARVVAQRRRPRTADAGRERARLGGGLRHGAVGLERVGRLHHRARHAARPLQRDLDDVAATHHVGPRGGAGQDHVARLEGHEPAEIGDQLGEGEDQVGAGRVLADLAVDPGGQMQRGEVEILGADRRADRREPVLALGQHVGAPVSPAEVVDPEVVGRRVEGDVIGRLLRRHVARAGADHDRDLTFERQ